MRRAALSLISLFAATALTACGENGGGDRPPLPGDLDAGGAGSDAGARADAGATPDGGGESDGGVRPDADICLPPVELGSGMCGVNPNVDFCRDPACPAATPWYRFVRGTAELSGNPVGETRPQVCVKRGDESACLEPGASCDDGLWVQELPEMWRCVEEIALRMSKFTDGSFAKTYCQVAPEGEGVLVLPEPLALYPVDRASHLPPLEDPTVTRDVQLQDGVRLRVTPALLENCTPRSTSCDLDYGILGVRRIVASDPTPCFVDPAEPPDVIYAFTVDVDVEGEGFEVVLDNPLGLPADTVVDLYVQGALLCRLGDGTEIPEGAWVRSGEARVSADGQTIVGGRLPCLNWFGYRARR